VLGDRVLIKADRDTGAPKETESGILLAGSLAAAVEGEDAEDSWFVGTVVQTGPLVGRRDVRQEAARLVAGYSGSCADLPRKILGLPSDCPDPVSVGDRVVFSWASGQGVNIDGDKYVLMHSTEVLAVIEEDV